MSRSRARRAIRAVPLALALALALPAWGAAPAPTAPPPGIAEVDAGDRAWAAGDRRAARAHWRSAASLAPGPGDGGPDDGSPGEADPAAAARALAELRLLLVSGNLGMARHGPRADAALAACDPAAPWCQLAAADRQLMAAQLGLPGRDAAARARAHAQAALSALPGPATARLVWAGAAPVAALDDHDGGGLGAVLAAGAGRWPTPGTWLAGLLIAGGSGQGLVLGARLDHPDLALAGHQLHARAWGSTRGAAGAAGRFRGAGTVGGLGALQAQHAVLDVYTATPAGGARRQTLRSWGGQAEAGVVWRPRPGTALEGGALGRADRLTAPARQWAGAGGWLGATQRLGPATTLQARLPALGGPELAQLRPRISLQHSPPAGLAAWALADGNIVGEGIPVWWQPSAGGGEVLRHGPLGRFRGPALGAAVLEWRQPVRGPLGLVAFAEGAWLGGPHGGGGLGLRLDLPPRPSNRLRFDVALGDGGLGVSAGVGALF